MNIAIIGAGNVASALGAGWIRAGHAVYFGVRNTQSPKSLSIAQQIPEAVLLSPAEACANAETVVFTTPADAIPSLIPSLGNLKNKTLIDATNAVRIKPDPYPTAYHAMKAITQSENVVKCFNTTGFENMKHPVYSINYPSPHSVPLDMFCASDHIPSKNIAKQLALDLGFGECYDFGGDDKVELLEKFALSWINLAIMQGHGRNIAIKIIRNS